MHERRHRFRLAIFCVLLYLVGKAPLAQIYTQSAPLLELHPSVGLNIDITEQSLINLAAYMRITETDSRDQNGWPASDFSLLLDNRPFFAGDPSIRNIDPLQYATNLAGVYRLTFHGEAIVSDATNSKYDRKTNTTTADYEIKPAVNGAANIVRIRFLLTRRTYDDTQGTGVTDIRLVRREDEKRSAQVFTDLWLDSIRKYPWSVLRCMDAMKTNEYGAPGSPEAYPHLLPWAERRLPAAGPLYANVSPGVHGVVAWEDLVILAQITHKDLWISIPVNASDEYVEQLAVLFHSGNAATGNKGIPADVKLYVEYSNELWGDFFPQGKWNDQAAQDEIARGATNLNYDGAAGTPRQWRFRRIAKRTVEIGRQFQKVFADNAGRIRPVLNNHLVDLDFDMLRYVEANYGKPAPVLYGIAQHGYYISPDSGSPQEILAGERAAAEKNRPHYALSRTLATYFGLHSLVYEGGPDETGPGDAPKDPSVVNPTLPNKFAAARDPAMKDVIYHDLMDHWFSSGGDLYVAFSQATRYSFWGMYGLTEDLSNLNTGKWMGYAAAMAAPLPPVSAGDLLPSRMGESVEIESSVRGSAAPRQPGPAPVGMFLLRVPTPGAFSFVVHGKSVGSAGTIRLMLDDSQVGSAQLRPDTEAAGEVKVTLDSGIHSLFVFLDGTQAALFPPTGHLTATAVEIH